MRLALRFASSVLALGIVGIAACSGPSPEPPSAGPNVRPPPLTGSFTCQAAASPTACNTLTSYCKDPIGHCALSPTTAYCVPAPTSCPMISGPYVCGCDGLVYSGVCTAAQQGVDVDLDATKCAAKFPSDAFACGNLICDASTEYCGRTPPVIAGGTDIFGCTPFLFCSPDQPGSCDCTKLASEGCSCTSHPIPNSAFLGYVVVCE